MSASAPLAPPVASFVEQFRAGRERLLGREVPWLERRRETAMARFRELGFPTPRQEAWRYTNVGPVTRRRFSSYLDSPLPQGALLASLAETVDEASRGLDDSYRLVFANGSYLAALSSLPGSGRLGVARSLSAGLTDAADTLETYLTRPRLQDHGFAALNAALMGDGAYLRIPAHTSLEVPLHVVYLSYGTDDDSDTTGYASHPCSLIVAEAGSSGVIVESFVTAGDAAHLTNGHTAVWVDEHAELDHYQIQHQNDASYGLLNTDVVVGGDASYFSHALGLGSRLARSAINVDLDAPGAHCTLNGLYLADGRRHLDYHTTVEHLKPDGVSRERYRGILDGHGRAVFNGRVVVHPDAQRSDASQSNHNLLLSRDAEIDTKPELEIYADDVKCAHGATVGQLDEDMLFYLRSRGLEEAEARATLIVAFMQEILEEMGLAGVREQARKVLHAMLPASARIRLDDEPALEVLHDS